MVNNNYFDHLMTNQPMDTDSISSFSEPNNTKVQKAAEYVDILKRVPNKKDKKKEKKKHKSKQRGGEQIDNLDGEIPHIPHGGFPPIYICDQFKQEEEPTKEREYTSHKGAVSIKDIMKNRRDVTPFISF